MKIDFKERKPILVKELNSGFTILIFELFENEAEELWLWYNDRHILDTQYNIKITNLVMFGDTNKSPIDLGITHIVDSYNVRIDGLPRVIYGCFSEEHKTVDDNELPNMHRTLQGSWRCLTRCIEPTSIAILKVDEFELKQFNV